MRSLRTFDALLLLADLGYGPQAMILARTFVEDMVTAWWIRQQDRSTLSDRLGAHDKSVAARLQYRATNSSDVLPSTRHLPRLTVEQYDELVASGAVDPNVAVRHWTGESVKQMASVAKQAMRPRERDRLDQLLGQPCLLANLLTHNSPASLGTTLAAGLLVTVDGVPASLFSRQPSTELVHDALATAYDALSLLAVLATDESNVADPDMQLDTDRIMFIVLPGEAQPGRNDRCPCGSGTKYKHCHGN
jgi:SEC-C motif/Family of unknown function (DUF5677)